MTSILDAVISLGIDGEQRGDEYVAPCPAHAERTGHPDHDPSWSINLEKGVFWCFSCHWKGTFGSLLSFMVGDEEAKNWEVAVAKDAATPADMNVLSRTLKHLEENRYIPPGRPVGFPEASLSVFTDPPDWAIHKRRVSLEACEQMGARWDSRRDQWALVIRDDVGNIIGWQYKSDRGPKEFSNYPAGMSKGHCLFGYHYIKNHLIDARSLVVVESPLDAVRFWGLGVPAVAICGSLLSNAQIALLKEFWVTIVPDNDTAGKTLRAQAMDVLDRLYVFDYTGLPAGVNDPGDLKDSILNARVLAAKSSLLLQMESYH